MRTWRTVAVVGISAGLTVLVDGSAAHAFDLQYAIQDTEPLATRPAFNPDSATLVGINRLWIIDGLSYSVCTDWNPTHPSISAALADWENVLPGPQFVPGNTCGTNPIRIQRASISPRPDGCTTFAFACVQWSVEPPDPQRGGRYTLPESIVWVDDLRNGGDAYDDNGLRHLVAHELGHIFGLHEAYDHDPDHSGPSIKCKDDTEASVMDFARLNAPFGRIIDGCDAVGPTPRDFGLVQNLYRTVKPASVNITSTMGPDVRFQFADTNPAEALNGVLVQRWLGAEWTTAAEFNVQNGVAPCSEVPCDNILTINYRKPATLPDGSYRVCVFAYNAVFLNSEARCSLSDQLRSDLAFDSDGDGFSDRNEAGTPLCQDNTNADAVDGDNPNDGCPTYGGLRELQCNDAFNDDAADDPLINDGCPPAGNHSEGDFKIGTDRAAYCLAPGFPEHDAWPADINKSGFADTADLALVTGVFGKAVTFPVASPSTARRNIAPEPVNPFVDTQDIAKITASFGKPCSSVPGAQPGISFAQGIYPGDGSAAKLIPVGFRPKVVMVKGDHWNLGNGGTGNAVYRSDTMPEAKNVTNGVNTDGILSLDSDGFTVKRDNTTCCGVTNEDGQNYYWYAFGGAGVETGTYPGNGEDNREIPISFAPVMVWVGQMSDEPVFRTVPMAAEDYDFSLGQGETDRIKSLEASSFTLGTDQAVNKALVPPITYHYVAFKPSTNLHVGSYVGNGEPGTLQPHPAMSFSADLVQIRDAVGYHAVWKVLSMAGSGSFGYGSGTQTGALILSLTSDDEPGKFEVSDRPEVNWSFAGTSHTYYFFAFDSTVPP